MTIATATTTTREEWLNQAADLLFIMSLNDIAESHGVTRHGFKISVGACGGTKAIGCCWPRSRSESGINEIFIDPSISDSGLVLATLTHELIHALDDNKSGHKGLFARMARKADLVGMLTATSAGDKLSDIIADIIDGLGNIPHARLDTTPVKKQGTRMLLVECIDPACGFRFRITRKHYENMTNNFCNCCGANSMQLEIK